MEWGTDTKNGYGALGLYMEYGYVLWVQLGETKRKWRIASLSMYPHVPILSCLFVGLVDQFSNQSNVHWCYKQLVGTWAPVYEGVSTRWTD